MRIPQLLNQVFRNILEYTVTQIKTSIEVLFFVIQILFVLDHEDHSVISILPITKPQFYEYLVTIALIYRSPNCWFFRPTSIFY